MTSEGGDNPEVGKAVKENSGGEWWGSKSRDLLTGSRLVSDHLYEAAKLTLEIVRRIQALEDNMITIGLRESVDHKNLLELKSDAKHFCNKICHLANYATKSKISAAQGKIGGGMETGGESIGRSGGESLEERAAAIESQERIVVKSDDEIREEYIIRSFLGKLFRDDAGDFASVLEEEKTLKEAEAVLSFGFRVHLIGLEIDELRQEMRGIVREFSPDNEDVRSTLIMFTCEPYLHRIAKLQWISKRISMLQLMDPDLDSIVKSKMTELKSQSFLSALKEKEERICGQGVTAEDRGKYSVEMDEKRFAAYRLCWERTWGTGYSFEDQSLLSPMQFTHCTPGRIPVDAIAGSSLQIYSIKLSGKKLDWPLEVYGVVAARDAADRHRNPLFLRTRNHCQILTGQDPFLQLTGPIRAVVLMDTVYIEIQLKRKGATESEDIVLVSTFMSCDGKSFSTCADDNRSCTIEFCSEQLEQSIQATILSVVVETSKSGSSPSPYGGKLLCSSLPCNGNEDFAGLSSRQILLFDSIDGELGRGDGHLDLLRRVVSVELNGKLKFQIERYSQSGSSEIDAHVLFTPKKSSISKNACYLDDGSKVEITVAWSLLPSSKMLS